MQRKILGGGLSREEEGYMVGAREVPERAREVPSAKKRVLVAGLFHQTNTFGCGRTDLEDFEIRRGEEMVREETRASFTAGLVGTALENGWELLPVVDMRAMPGGKVADAVVDLFWAEFRAVADAEARDGVDGVFLVVHGAMVSESLQDVEGEVLRRIRGLEHLSDAPVCGVMDPHANFTEVMARQSDGLIAHRENPLTDTSDTATLAATILEGLMQTENRPATVWDHPPILWRPSVTAIDRGPMLPLEERAREIEADLPDVLAANVLAVNVPVCRRTRGGCKLLHCNDGRPGTCPRPAGRRLTVGGHRVRPGISSGCRSTPGRNCGSLGTPGDRSADSPSRPRHNRCPGRIMIQSILLEPCVR